MTSRTCFVIMPYGGDDESAKKHYRGVYESIIRPAAQAAGFDVKRSDISGAPGDITKDIILDLATADVVIADLSEANPNVFFELGIRHALRKSGTIHIVNKSHHIPFDVRQYRVVQYTTDLSELPASIAEIRGSIEKRLNQPDRSDNPVHDTLRHLPVNVSAEGSEERLAQVRQLQQTIDELSDENDVLSQRLHEVEANPRAEEEQDIDALFDAADHALATSGENALLRLTSAANEGGTDKFVRVLRDTIKSPYLDENDFLAIAKLCDDLDADPHQVAVLREALRRFPDSRVFFTLYVGNLMRSPSRERRLEGARLCEERFGVTHDGESIQITNASAVTDVQDIFPLFDYYLLNDKAAWGLALIEAVQPFIGEVPLLLRNKARALGKLRRDEEAADVFKKAIEDAPEDDTLFAFYSDFLDDAGRYEDAYVQIEHALQLDPTDGDRYINLAVQILNRGFCRGDDGQIRYLKLRRARVRAAVPFLVAAVLRATINRQTQKAVSILARERFVREAEALLQGNVPEGEFDMASFKAALPDGELTRQSATPSDE